jgi:hypothetical protein
MPIGTDFLPFANSTSANVETQADYAAASYLPIGIGSEVARSKQANKVWRQTSIMASAIANFTTRILNVFISDDGNLNALTARIWQALQGQAYFVDTGSANNISIAAPSGLTFSAPYPGMLIYVKIANSNTSGTVNLNYCGTGNVLIGKYDGTAPNPGELPANAIIPFVYTTSPSTRWMVASYTPQAVKIETSKSSVQSFTSAGAFSFTVPANVFVIRELKYIGGGGGGGFGNATGGCASGGSAGATGYKSGISVTPGQIITGIVGAGGAPSTTTGVNGGTGGTTSVTIGTTTYTAPGGLGGLSSATGSANSPGIASLPTNTDPGRAFRGGRGSFGVNISGTSYSGNGGDAVDGGNGGIGGAGIGAPGDAPGGGGGGSGSGAAAGAGAPGAVYIEY